MKKYNKFLVVISHLKISEKFVAKTHPTGFSASLCLYSRSHSRQRIFFYYMVWTFWGQENLPAFGWENNAL